MKKLSLLEMRDCVGGKMLVVPAISEKIVVVNNTKRAQLRPSLFLKL